MRLGHQLPSRAPRAPLLVLLAALLAAAPAAGPARATCTSQNACIPPGTGCGYASTCDVFFANGFAYRNLAVHDCAACVNVLPGQTTSGGFACQVDLSLSPDAGSTWTAYSGVPATAWMTFTWTGSAGGADVYTATLDQLDASGGGLPGNVLFRESPILGSTGQADVTATGGDVRIDSFFDVFFEISLDDGLDWTPALGPCRIAVGPFGPTPARTSTWGALKILYR